MPDVFLWFLSKTPKAHVGTNRSKYSEGKLKREWKFVTLTATVSNVAVELIYHSRIYHL